MAQTATSGAGLKTIKMTTAYLDADSDDMDDMAETSSVDIRSELSRKHFSHNPFTRDKGCLSNKGNFIN